jgi:ubiquinone/menaquinone biosynthesis C-methylase UbiE
MENEQSWVVRPEYEYHGLLSTTWDLLRGDTTTWPDRDFYLRLIRESGEPVLDVGCGTGRLLLDYLALGIDIDGIDVSPEMLQICGARAREAGVESRVFQQPMEGLQLVRRYRTIIVPSSSFQLLTDARKAKQALRRFYRHLVRDGRIAMPFLVIGAEDGDAAVITEATRPFDGALVRRTQQTSFDPTIGFESTRDLFEVIAHGRVVESEIHTRSPATKNYTVDEARNLIEDAGFSVERIVSGFSDSTWSSEDQLFSVIARKAGPDG